MDLVGRKLAMNGGRGLRAYLALLTDSIAAGKADTRTAALAGGLEAAAGELQAATMWLMQNGMANPDNAGAGATAYMHLLGIVALGEMWLRMARASVAALDAGAGAGDAGFYDAKLLTARYFAERNFPDCGALRRKIEAGSAAMMAMPAEAF
jgi:hypothetical protein